MSEKIDELEKLGNIGAYDELTQDSIKTLIAESYLKSYDKNATKLPDLITAIDSINREHGDPFLRILGDYGRASYRLGGTEYGQVPKSYHHQGIARTGIDEGDIEYNLEHGYPKYADWYQKGIAKPTESVKGIQDTINMFSKGFLLGPIKPGYPYIEDPDTGDYYSVTKDEGSLFNNWLAELIHAKDYRYKSGFVRDSLKEEGVRQRKFYDETVYDIQEQDKLLKDFPDMPAGSSAEALRDLFTDALGKPTIESAHDREEGIIFNQLLGLLGQPQTKVKEGSMEDILKLLENPKNLEGYAESGVIGPGGGSSSTGKAY